MEWEGKEEADDMRQEHVERTFSPSLTNNGRVQGKPELRGPRMVGT
jgi:hypothetical protein